MKFKTIAALYFSPEIARRNLDIAASTYCDAGKWNYLDGIKVIARIPDKSTIIIAEDTVQNATVVAIRGSANIDNWIHNFEFEMTTPYADKSVRVHKGLYAEYLSYRDEVLPYVENADNVIFTGHSSGSAVAMFFAYDAGGAAASETGVATSSLPRTPPTKEPERKGVVGGNYVSPTVYSFGSPRIGNDRFAETAKHITHYRITHANDIVPHLPEEVFGYRHTETEIWFPTSSSDEYVICEGNEDPKCSNSCAPLDCISVDAHLNYMGVAIGSDGCSR